VIWEGNYRSDTLIIGNTGGFLEFFFAKERKKLFFFALKTGGFASGYIAGKRLGNLSFLFYTQR
jgi:hypothetical protein